MNRPVEVISRPFWEGTVVLRARLKDRAWLGVLLLVLLSAAFGLLQLSQAATLTSVQAEIHALDADYIDLQRECRYWQAELAQRTSMQEIILRAGQLELYPPADIVTIVVPPSNLPAEPAGAGATERPAGLTEGAQAPWWYTLVGEVEARVRGETP